ncbi:MAG: hypothetical protein IJH20_02200 [Bacilli bacterium]|nr:hypothetical protein [Bacilli bacterium]
MKNNRIVDISQFYDENVGTINRLTMNSSIETLSKFDKLLPDDDEISSDDIATSWRYGYLMKYFMGVIVTDELDKDTTQDVRNYNNIIENIRFRMFIMFFRENYSNNVIYYEEFVKFSRLLNETIIHDEDIVSADFKDKIISSLKTYSNDNLGVVYNIIHELNGKEYKFDKNKLKLVIGRVKTMSLDSFGEEVDKIESRKNILELIKKED